MLTLLLALACESPDPAADSAVFVGSDELAEPHHPEATWTADEAATALKEAVRWGFPLPGPAVELWTELLSHGDEHCPGGDYKGGALSVFDPAGCIADSGYWYGGVGGAGVGWSDMDMNGVPEAYIVGMKTDGSIRDAEGNAFTFGGLLTFELTGDPLNGGPYEAEVLGTYEYPPAEDLWLQKGTSTGSYLVGVVNPDSTWTLNVNGGFTVADVAVSMADFEINTTCGKFPSGTIGIRDTAGYWYDLTYDETTCDACGEMVFDGRTDLGRACSDVSPSFAAAMEDLVGQMMAAGGPK